MNAIVFLIKMLVECKYSCVYCSTQKFAGKLSRMSCIINSGGSRFWPWGWGVDNVNEGDRKLIKSVTAEFKVILSLVLALLLSKIRLNVNCERCERNKRKDSAFGA